MNPYLFGLLSLELLVVSWLDLRHKKISNLWLLCNLGAFLLGLILFPSVFQWDWHLLIIPLSFIVGGFILFLADIMGAGDSKYLASLFLLVPLDYHLVYAEKILLVTMVVGGMLLLRTILRNREKFMAYFYSRHWRGMRELIRSRFSYAPVMLMAWLLLGLQKWF